MEPTTNVEMDTVIYDVFKKIVWILNPEGGGKYVFAFDAICLIKAMFCIWADMYALVATSQEEVFRYKALLDKEILKLSQTENNIVKKIQGEFEVKRQKLRAV